jgi:hypothetical protein
MTTPSYAHDAHCNTIHEPGPQPCPPYIPYKGFQQSGEVKAPPVITGNKFIDALLAAGIITAEQRVRRVVIEASFGEATVMHLERYGDTRLLEVVPALTGVQIRETPQSDGAA